MIIVQKIKTLFTEFENIYPNLDNLAKFHSLNNIFD